MSKTVEIECPNCGRKIGIPAASETIHITCPACREHWDWSRGRKRSSGSRWKRAEAFADRVFERSMVLLRDFLGPRRFTGVHIVIAVLGGAVFGFICGVLEEQWRTERFSKPVPVSVSDATATNSPAATTQTTQP